MREKIVEKIIKAKASVISEDELADQILSLLEEKIKKSLLTDDERMGVYIPCETCKDAISTKGGATPDFDTVICLDCAAKCHIQAQLDKVLKIVEEK